MQIQSEIKGCKAVLYLEPLLTLPSLGAIWFPSREEFDMTQRKGRAWLSCFTWTRLCRLQLESSWHPEPAASLPQSRDIASWRQQDHQLADTTTIS